MDLEQSCKTFHETKRLPIQNFWKTLFEKGDRQDILSDARYSEYFAWKPKSSNCPELQSLLEQLIDSVPDNWRTRARRIFAGRTLDFLPNGKAWRDGQVGVIEINYGVTSAAMIYSVLYCKYFEMIRTIGLDIDFTDDDSDTLKMILDEVGDSGFSPILKADSERNSWRSHRAVYAGHELLRELPASRSMDSYHESVRAIEEFILAHELAHHLLGHTADPYPRARQNSNHLDKMLQKYQVSLPEEQEMNDDQLQELSADALALFIMTGALTDELEAPRIYRASAGAIIGLTALAHIDDSWVSIPGAPGETHPDFISRFSLASHLIKAVSSDIPVGDEGGHPFGFLSQLSGFVSIILNHWLAEHIDGRSPVNVLSLTNWLFERSLELQRELEHLGLYRT
ncbi:hypothetical protein [Streptomyces sp. NPDC058142]|uniref:hypothetical protein n=1 Tax=Streptomyces sp. NPDC058142 TaxID=3346355 RepID=UPI0036E1B5A3